MTNDGPYLHTFTTPDPVEFTRVDLVGRWPGIVHLWRSHAGRRLARPWRWFLYGNRTETTYEACPTFTIEGFSDVLNGQPTQG